MPSLLIITDAHRARHASHNHSHTMTVIFDFGGVLVDWNQRYYYRQYFNDDERMEYFLSHVLTNEWNLENDRGRPYSEGVRLLCAQYPEWREAIEAFPTHWPEMLHAAKPEGVALLRELKAKGYKLYGLTNWSAENIGIAYGRYDFFSLFDGIVVSGIERQVKPEPQIYHTLLDRYNLQADDCVFIDDNAANIATACRLGIHGVLYDDIHNVRAQLRQFLGDDI